MGKSRTGLIIVVIVVLLMAVYQYASYVEGYGSLAVRLWLLRCEYGQVQLGTPKSKIGALFGTPNYSSTNPIYTSWKYELAPRKGTKPASSAQTFTVDVHFSPDGRVTEVWSDPPVSGALAKRIPVVGMTQLQVSRKMGKPAWIYQARLAENWSYTHWNGTKHSYGFDKSGHVIYVSIGYNLISRPGETRSTSPQVKGSIFPIKQYRP